MKRIFSRLSRPEISDDQAIYSGLPSNARDLSRAKPQPLWSFSKIIACSSLLLLSAYIVVAVAFPGYATLPNSDKKELHLFMVAAVDRDCDGSLLDEAETDRKFGTTKTLLPAECLVYRTKYRNDGDFGIRHVRVTNIVPPQMTYIDGSAEHISTPPGLWPETTVAPSENESGSLVWRFGGALAPGEVGEIQFRVRLQP